MGNEQAKLASPSNSNSLNGLHRDTSTFQIPQILPAKFNRGIQYNLKIVIRGDIMTGKSTLFSRLQGQKFEPTYTSTSQINVANIQYNYPGSDDIIKVEVWDVVDKGDKLVPLNSSHVNTSDTELKLSHSMKTKSQIHQPQLSLDSETVDVYRNTHGAIVLFDITKPWTFEYAAKHLSIIPHHISVLLVGNFHDKVSKRAVSRAQIRKILRKCNDDRFVEGQSKWAFNKIRYTEASMANGYGLDYIYKYFGVPFLELQTKTLRILIENKTSEMIRLLQNLDTEEDFLSGPDTDEEAISESVANDIMRGDPIPTLPQTSQRGGYRDIASKARAAKPVMKATKVLATYQPSSANNEDTFWNELGTDSEKMRKGDIDSVISGTSALRDLDGWLDETPNPMVSAIEEEPEESRKEELEIRDEVVVSYAASLKSESSQDQIVRDDERPSDQPTTDPSNPWAVFDNEDVAGDSSSFGPNDLEEDSVAAAWGSIRTNLVTTSSKSHSETSLPRTTVDEIIEQISKKDQVKENIRPVNPIGYETIDEGDDEGVANDGTENLTKKIKKKKPIDGKQKKKKKKAKE